MLDKLQDAKRFLSDRKEGFPSTVVILGSGMSTVLSEMKTEQEISFSEIPHVPAPGVEGHVGKIRLGKVGGKRVAVVQGRLHYYEGHSIQTVVFPVRAMALAGAQTFILTNAAGGVHPEMKPMTLMLIRDHINMMGTNPLHGPNLSELGPRFPDLTDLYDPGIQRTVKRAAERLGIVLNEGVYVGWQGPSYETASEVRLSRTLGGDAVGMSTVPEAIALRHMGRRVAGISCITNLAAGVTGEPLNHAEVLENALATHASLNRLLWDVLQELE